MAVDMFIKINGIDGESEDDKHGGEIDVISWAWGLNQTSTMQSGSGGGAGKANVQDLKFTHTVDKASPNLFLYCANGKHIDEVKLVVRKAGEKPLEYLKITMNDAIITAVTNSGTSADEQPLEQVSLSFAKVKMEYQPQDNKGGAKGGAITAGWDIKKNVKA